MTKFDYSYFFYLFLIFLLILATVIGFQIWVTFNYPAIACEDVCVITKKASINEKGSIKYDIYFAKQGSDLEYSVRIRNRTVFYMAAIGDTVGIYGGGELDDYRYRFCEDYPGSKQYELWCANKLLGNGK